MDTQKIAWVTGAGKGIGEAIALALGASGLKVAVSARSAADIDRVAATLREKGGESIAVVCDVTQPESIRVAVAQIQNSLGPIAILVNGAGAAESQKFLGHDDALWRRMIDVNLNSVYYVCKEVAPLMVEAKWGRIINIASIASKVGGKYVAAYTAAKHGVLGLTRALALELVAHNITVNAICPGYVDTPLTDQSIAAITRRTKLSENEARAALEKISPQNRLITSAEVAHVALMLVHDNARGITGQAINVDGGTVMF
ncbi:MAG TPA: SDR family NAD(P)-dependent oxidoreductase [Anaerolineae bacterium]|nr:SDR family NAD(P)-dependent oxidoreductase [Anaerolineae bacterium]